MKRMPSHVMLALWLVAMGSANGQAPVYKFTQYYTSNDSVQFKCSFYVPRSYDSTKSYPFFYAWHGAGMEARTMRDLVVSTIANNIDAIVVAPEFNNVTTNAHMNFLLDTTLNFTRSTYNLDPARSILTGYSAGGRISFALGLYYPQNWSGIIGLAPAFAHGDMDDTMWANIGKIRMAAIIGDQDFNFPYVDSFMKDVPTRGGNLLYIVKPGVQHSDPYFSTQAFKDDYRACYDYVIGATSARTAPDAPGLAFDVYPQPVSTVATIRIDGALMHDAEITVTDALGRVAYRASAVAGSTRHHLTTAQWTPGIYVVRLHGGGPPVVRKMLVVR